MVLERKTGARTAAKIFLNETIVGGFVEKETNVVKQRKEEDVGKREFYASLYRYLSLSKMGSCLFWGLFIPLFPFPFSLQIEQITEEPSDRHKLMRTVDENGLKKLRTNRVSLNKVPMPDKDKEIGTKGRGWRRAEG